MGLKHQYDKNARMMVLSQPLPREKLPHDIKVFTSVMACRIKEKGTDLWKFETRLCLNGKDMVQGRDFDFSYSPTISYPGFRTAIALTAILGYRLFILDVENCFQNH